MPLTPFHVDDFSLDPIVSFNRVRLVDLPGAPAPLEVRGKTAYEALGAPSLVASARERAASIGLRADIADGAVLPVVDGCLSSHDKNARAAAVEFARERGRALGHVLLTLNTGANREARPDWSDAHWRHWSSIEHVVIGGGVVSGALGEAMIAAAAGYLHRTGAPNLDVRRSDYGPHIVCAGLARLAPSGIERALVLDFGGTTVKRARAEYQSGKVVGLTRLASLPSPSEPALRLDPSRAQALWARLWEIVQSSWTPDVEALGVALACHMRSGQPLLTGGYGVLGFLSSNFERYLAEGVAEWRGRQVPVRVLHDGTAAATAYGGEDHSVVLTLGSAIGVGFSPPAAGLRPIAGPLVLG